MGTIHVAVVDLETTGLDPADHRIVELAAVRVALDADDPAPRPVTLVDTLADPGRPIPVQASAVHHLTATDTDGKPPPEQVVRTLAEALAAHPCDAFAAHQADFERAFLAPHRTALGAAADLPWLCTRILARHLWPDAPSHANLALRYERQLQGRVPIGGDHGFPHRARFDATCTAVLLADEFHALAVAPAPLGKGRHPTLDELVAATAQVPLETRVRFGKHAGKPWREVPNDYLRWLLSEHRSSGPASRFEATTVVTAEAALRGVYR